MVARMRFVKAWPCKEGFKQTPVKNIHVEILFFPQKSGKHFPLYLVHQMQHWQCFSLRKGENSSLLMPKISKIFLFYWMLTTLVPPPKNRVLPFLSFTPCSSTDCGPLFRKKSNSCAPLLPKMHPSILLFVIPPNTPTYGKPWLMYKLGFICYIIWNKWHISMCLQYLLITLMNTINTIKMYSCMYHKICEINTW